MGFKSGPGCGTMTAIVSQTGLRFWRDVPSGKPWPVEDTGRMHRGWMLVSVDTRRPVTVESADMSASPRRRTDRLIHG